MIAVVASAVTKLAAIVTTVPVATLAGDTVALEVNVGTTACPAPAFAGAGATGAITLRRLRMPSSSSHVTPSTTGRRGKAYVPGVVGARTRNVNVPIAPGITTSSVCTATRS